MCCARLPCLIGLCSQCILCIRSAGALFCRPFRDSPFAACLQAIPYTYTLFYCPMHFLTHEILLFATGVWTTNIHDCLHGRVWPIMGAGECSAARWPAARDVLCTCVQQTFNFVQHCMLSLCSPADNTASCPLRKNDACSVS